jgi:DNA polymerase-1
MTAHSKLAIYNWSSDRGLIGDYVAYDCETQKIVDGKIPGLVFATACASKDEVFLIEEIDIIKFFEVHKSCNWFMHNAPFDLYCSLWESNRDLFFQIAEKTFDTMLLFLLLELAMKGQVPRGGYGLADLSEKLLGEQLDKSDRLRLGAAPYFGKPLSEIPEEVKHYGAADSRATLLLGIDLLTKAKELSPEKMLSHSIQLKGALALYQAGVNGFAINEKLCREFHDHLSTVRLSLSAILADKGIFPGKPGVEKALRSHAEKVAHERNISLPVTATAETSLAESALQCLAESDGTIKAYLEFKLAEKKQALLPRTGISRVYPRYLPLVNTGRTACNKPNLQQIPKVPVVRKLFTTATESKLFTADFKAIELCSLAQICIDRFGHSRMGQLINLGADLHRETAARMFGVDPRDVTKEQRQGAKAANFGFSGGLGANSFTLYAESTYGLKLSLEDAQRFRQGWLEAFPEMEKYLADGKAGHPVLKFYHGQSMWHFPHSAHQEFLTIHRPITNLC